MSCKQLTHLGCVKVSNAVVYGYVYVVKGFGHNLTEAFQHSGWIIPLPLANLLD